MAASPPRELGFALNDVARLLRTFADQRARSMSATRAQWAVLSRLQRCEGASQAELAEQLDLTPITLARLIDKLTAAGLVERRSDASDRRIRRLHLTEMAGPKLEKLAAIGEEIMGKALEGVDEEEILKMRSGLDRMKSNLKCQLKAGV